MRSTLIGNGNWYFFRALPCYVLVLLIFFTMSSCNNTGDGNEYAAYDKVLDTVNRVYDNGNNPNALKYLDSATANYKNLSVRQKFYYYQCLYNFYSQVKHDKNKGMLYADSMLNLFNTKDKQAKYSSQCGLAYFYKGDILFDENKFSEAYVNYYQGKLIASKSVDNCTLADYAYRMAMIMYKQEHYRLAAAYFKQCSSETNSCDWSFRSFYRRQELLSNTGLSYSALGEQDSAMIYYNKALHYIDSAGAAFTHLPKDPLGVARAVIYGNQANVYIKQKQYKLAGNLLKKSIAVNLKKGDDNLDAQYSELKLARIYEMEDEPDSLISILNNIKAQFANVKTQDSEADWDKLMADYYIKHGNAKAAFEYLKYYDALKDSISNHDKILKEADVSQQMKRLEKNYEYTELQKSNKLQHLYLSIAIVFGLMLLLIISLILTNWRKSRKNIKVLDKLNSKIKDQNHNLERALDELNTNSLEKDRILRTVAHDLRNPLGGVASLAGLMVTENEYTDEQKELISLIRETSNNSIELINEILDATEHSQSRPNKNDKENVEINALLSHSVELLRFKAAEKNQQIILELLDTPVELHISREKIWRVVSNLISNAIKFSGQDALIRVKIYDETGSVKIAVSDNGIGIPDNIKDKIFNMFTDAKRPGTAGERSFGLGLSICRQIIENHDGKIWFESREHNGTTFFVRLNKP
jgi:signal transduction histidine kinase